MELLNKLPKYWIVSWIYRYLYLLSLTFTDMILILRKLSERLNGLRGRSSSLPPSHLITFIVKLYEHNQ